MSHRFERKSIYHDFTTLGWDFLDGHGYLHGVLAVAGSNGGQRYGIMEGVWCLSSMGFLFHWGFYQRMLYQLFPRYVSQWRDE